MVKNKKQKHQTYPTKSLDKVDNLHAMHFVLPYYHFFSQLSSHLVSIHVIKKQVSQEMTINAV